VSDGVNIEVLSGLEKAARIKKPDTAGATGDAKS